MALVVAVIVGFAVLDGPLRWVLIAGGLVIEVVEAGAMIRLSRRRRAVVGLEALVGREAIVTTACTPDGTVRIDGEIWAARCEAGCAVGDVVRIARADGLVLVVERREGTDIS